MHVTLTVRNDETPTAPNVHTEYDVDAVRNPSASPCEVSLGIGGKYFIRFLDGGLDYSVPNFVTEAFGRLEADGKLVRDMALHVET